MTTSRRLAAILAADVAGYSAAMELDEEGTAAAVRALRRGVIEPRLTEHQGRLIKTTGDGFLVEFASPIAALKCALAIQQRPGESSGLRLRIGLNLGDVIIEESGDVLGEGVNVAARLEGLAEPGGILVSSKVHSEVEGKVQVTFEDRGEQQVKNISKPVRVYAVRLSASKGIEIAEPGKLLPLPDKPSIAVLPFQNMSGDPEQEYFADGIVEDIITALSRFKSLFVIARNSSFTYKGKAVEIKQIGRELGVRYVLEGSVRKSGGRVRITGQLIDTSNDGHLWADKFDGPHDDIFDLQDRITAQVVGLIAPHVERAEVARLRLVRTENLNAYDLCLRALENMRQFNADGFTKGIELSRQAIALDPMFSSAYAVATQCFGYRRSFSLMQDEHAEVAEGTAFAKKAVATGQDDAFALAVASFYYGSVLHEMDLAVSLADQAIRVNPNLVEAWRRRGYVSVWIGRHEEAIEHLETALRLSPMDPDIHTTYQSMSNAYLYLRRFDDALSWSAKAVLQKPELIVARRMGIAANVAKGNLAVAKRLMAELRTLEPQMTLSRLRQTMPARRPQDREFLMDCMRQAGMPE